MQHMFLWQEELNSLYTDSYAGKIICVNILSFAAEQ